MANTIFFTGAGGFIGQYLLPHFFDHEEELYLLEFGNFIQRLNDFLDANAPEEARKRIHVVPGDITKPDLGLEPALQDKLKNTMTKCIHLGAIYNLSVPREVAWKVNVEGTRNVLDFIAKCPNFNRLAFASTTAVVGYYKGRFSEDDFDMGQSFKNNYDETKFESEKLVRERWDRIPSVIYRPGYVIGDTKHGRIEKIDGPYYAMTMIKRRLHLVVPKGADTYFHLVPVDYVADAMYYLLMDEHAANQAYHLTDPNPCTYDEFFDLTCAAMGTFKPLLRLNPRILAPIMRRGFIAKITGVPYEAFQYADHPIEYDTTKTEAVMAHYGVHCPHLSEYIDVLVKFFLEHYNDPHIRRGDWQAGAT
ncbi:MAG: SDR family oxidoreductase [Candidatus Hydrogenedentota bacterium]